MVPGGFAGIEHFMVFLMWYQIKYNHIRRTGVSSAYRLTATSTMRAEILGNKMNHLMCLIRYAVEKSNAINDTHTHTTYNV